MNSNRDDWDDHLPAVICAYRATPHDSTGVTPFKMLYGREIAMPIDLQFDLGERIEVPRCAIAYVDWVRDSLRLSHEFARGRLQVSAKRQKKNYQEHSRDAVFKRGDWVWKVDPQRRYGKLHPKNTGPWLVIARISEVVYKVQRSEAFDPKLVHVDKLSKYYPEIGEQLRNWISNEGISLNVSTQAPEIESEAAIISPTETTTKSDDPTADGLDPAAMPATAAMPSLINREAPVELIPMGTRRSTRQRVTPDRFVAMCAPMSTNAGWGSRLTPEIVQFVARMISPYLKYRSKKKQAVQIYKPNAPTAKNPGPAAMPKPASRDSPAEVIQRETRKSIRQRVASDRLVAPDVPVLAVCQMGEGLSPGIVQALVLALKSQGKLMPVANPEIH